MKLQELPKIISFYPKTDKTASTDTPHSQSLFNEKVVFPALEELVINELPQITQIFDKELLTEESFCQLRDVNLRYCKLLVNVFPSNMLSRLQNLQELYAYNCDNMEVIISMKGEEECDEAETKDNIILLPKLRTLRLENLNDLKSFYSSTCEAQPLFNKQVIFPVLEELEIWGMPNITEIWEKQSVSVQDKAESSEHEKLINDFSKLRVLVIMDMKNLKSFCTNSKISKSQPLFNHQVIFPVLAVLRIKGLPNITEIWDLQYFSVQDKAESSEREKVMNAKELANADIFVFSKLWFLVIMHMKNLKSFCTNSKISKSQPLFNYQVAFPSLERLAIEDVPNITEIWENQPLLDPQNKTESFYKLIFITITNCGDLVNVFPYYMLPQLQINLRELVIKSCPKVEVIVSKKAKEKETATEDIIVFQTLWVLRLEDLENLKSFFAEAQFFFDNKDTFPKLEGIYLDENLKKIFLKGISSEEECASKGEEG
ncbi:uncharacterized protein LOC130756366 isoform X1 [Actinidia eriantha]|uniref:uncharacterized protein LOC130756366 isoform X1 n=1 Tax=Actinidia eriantha TaxID=165200 RepID=UPI00258A40D7|nr:uncharacterized protein LOC130756366 isoform X1 [Actinidia eriantha]